MPRRFFFRRQRLHGYAEFLPRGCTTERLRVLHVDEAAISQARERVVAILQSNPRLRCLGLGLAGGQVDDATQADEDVGDERTAIVRHLQRPPHIAARELLAQ